MSTSQELSHCFLCGAEARSTDTDAGNRKFFLCTNPQCGDYEISTRAMRRMEDNHSHKQVAMVEAHAHRGSDLVVEICVGADNQVVLRPVPREQIG